MGQEAPRTLGFMCCEILPGSPEAKAQDARLNKDVYLATDEADKYRTQHRVIYVEPSEKCWTCVPVLHFLWGRPWNNMALNFMEALRPSCIRVVQRNEGVTCDTVSWRVTVHLREDDRTIDRIEQEVTAGCRGIRYGHDLSCYIAGVQPPAETPSAIFNPRGLSNVRLTPDHTPNFVGIVVNGQPQQVNSLGLTYEQVVTFAGMTGQPSMTYRNGGGERPEGTLSPGQAVTLKDGMIFNVQHTGNA